MKNYTDITILLDRSGSMGTIKNAMEEALNSFLTKHKEVPSTRVTLVQFDDQNKQEIVFQCVPINYVEKVTINPRGMTPLNDALGMLIDRTGERLANMNEADRPDQVLLVVITDGAENASTKFSRCEVNSKVSRQRDHYSWEFIYLGANHDAFKEAELLGMDRKKAMWYDINRVDPAVMSLMSNTVAYASAQGPLRGRSASKSLEFTEQQLEDAQDKTRFTGITPSTTNTSSTPTKR